MANTIVPITGLRGVNLLRDPRRIADDELVRAQNVVPLKPGILSKRPAMGFFQASVGVAPSSSTVLSFGVLSFESAVSYVITRKDSFGDLYVFGLGSGSDLFVPNSRAVTNPQHVNFNGFTYILFGYPCGWAGVQVSNQQGQPDIQTFTEYRQNGVDFKQFAFAGSGNENVRPRVATQYRSRMVYGDFGPGQENTVVFSDNFQADVVGNSVLAANGRNLVVGGARDGDKIVALVEVMQTAAGSPTSAALLVLKQYSAFIITGEPNQTTDSGGAGPLGTLEVSQVSFNCGCASPNSIARTPYGIIWASFDDVWFYPFGQVPIRIGSKIRPVLSTTPANVRYKWQATYFNGFYRLAVFADGQGPIDTSPLGEQWWLDLRDGPPQGTPGEMEAHESAAWWGPQIFKTVASAGATAIAGTHFFATEIRPGHAPALYGIEPSVENSWNIVTYDLSSAIDSTSDNANLHSASGTEIISNLVSKEFDFGDIVLDKTVYGTELSTWTNDNARVNMDDIIDGGDVTVPMSQDIRPASGFQLDVNQLDLTSFGGHRTENYALYPDASTPVRYMGKTHQLNVYDSGGFIITESNQSFQLSNETYNSGAIATVIISTGRYATIDALIIEMLNKANLLPGLVDSYTYGYSVDGKVIFSSVGSNNWYPVLFDNASDSSADLWSRLGYVTNINRTGAADQTADNSVYTTTATLLELAETNLIINVIPRRSP